MSVLEQTAVELRRAAGEARSRWSSAAWLSLGVLVVAAAVPFLSLPGVRLDALADTAYLALAATALGLTVGPAGLPSLGTGAFMAIGAFTSALLVARSGWPLEPAVLAGTAAALVAGLLSGGVVRLRRAFVAVSTWLLAWLVWLYLLAFPSVSGGSQGLILPSKTLLGLDGTPTVHFEVALALTALTALAVAAVRRGAPGLELSALRQAPGLATSLGVRLERRRLGAFTASAAIAGLAGGLAVQLQAVADPASYDPFLSFKLLVAVLLGGAAATLGPATGVTLLGLIGLVSGPLARALQLPLERFDTAVAALLLVFVLALGGRGVLPWVLRRIRGDERPDRPPGPRPARGTPGPREPVLGASGLRKAFGGVVAVDGLSLELSRGETAALIGPNGSGKTTALRLISGASAPDAGAITLAGAEITAAATADRVRLGIARTLQSTASFPELTALENVLVGRASLRRFGGLFRTALATPHARREQAAAEAAALEALSVVGLGEVADVATPELTTSQRRLIALAAALATEPEVLLVDELAAGAGVDELEALVSAVERIRDRGVAVLVVEHNLRLVRRVADRVLVLAAGSVVAQGSVAEVAASGVVQEAYLGTARL
ncbi:MAG TPA: ATP-binding cassette domain-containing protein [Gaiellaceae bacterium]|jgi:branched-chain amino acid transport system permease protein|nr:ATP-binding cassette domain-containing protein [Gaiellaceae bacterium]